MSRIWVSVDYLISGILSANNFNVFFRDSVFSENDLGRESQE